MADLKQYDLAIIGGGIAGASLGRSMAEAGARVLILEGVNRFTDRVRGEGLLPWGAAEIERLGLKDCFAKAGALEFRWLDQYLGAQKTEHRDLPATTLTRTPAVSFLSPENADLRIGGGWNARGGSAARDGGDGNYRRLPCSREVCGEWTQRGN